MKYYPTYETVCKFAENPVYGLQFHPESILTPEGKKMLENFFRQIEK